MPDFHAKCIEAFLGLLNVNKNQNIFNFFQSYDWNVKSVNYDKKIKILQSCS